MEISPWFINQTYMDYEKATEQMHALELESLPSVFSTGILQEGRFLLGQLHIERLLQGGKTVFPLYSDSTSQLQKHIREWCSKLSYQKENIRIKIVISEKSHPIFMAYTSQLFPEQVSLMYSNSNYCPFPKNKELGFIKMGPRKEHEDLYQVALNEGYDDALLCNHAGDLIETTRSAFWFLSNQTLFYPDPLLGGIDSITKKVMVATAHQLGYLPKKWKGSLAEIPKKSRCYISNCVRGVQSVGQIGLNHRFPIDIEEQIALNQILMNFSIITAV